MRGIEVHGVKFINNQQKFKKEKKLREKEKINLLK